MSTAVLDRINFRVSDATRGKLTPIAWPSAMAPKGVAAKPDLGKADVLVVTYTSAEKQALADVLCPGHPWDDWEKYVVGWDLYEPQLTGDSPARFSKCLGQFAYTEIGGKLVALFGCDLHLSTDSKSLPVRQLWQQLIAAVKPEMVITTGTAGGIGVNCMLGDVIITNGAKFNASQGEYEAEPWAQATYIGPEWTPGASLPVLAEQLMQTNAAKLKPVNPNGIVALRTVVGRPGVETVPFFGFADYDDAYGIAANDPDAGTEEMDDAVLPLALEGSEGQAQTPWLSIRNASDPQVPDVGDLAVQKKWAEVIYQKYGYLTTVGSAVATGAVIYDL